MTEMGFFVLGFTVTLAIIVVADAVVRTAAQNDPGCPDRGIRSGRRPGCSCLLGL